MRVSPIVILSILLQFIFCLSGIAQTKKQFLEAADNAVAEKNYHGALVYYKTVADAWPEDVDVHYQTAEAARNYHSYLLAEKYYQLVIDKDLENTYPEASFHLAGIKRNLGKYGDAITLYQRYDQIRVDKTKNCSREVEHCRFAIQANRFVLPMDLIPIGVNTEFSDFAPVRIGDTLFYTSLNFPLDEKTADSEILVSRIYESSNDVLGQLLRSQMQEGNRHIAHTAFNADQTKMYFSICKNINITDYHCELFVAEKVGSEWASARKLPESINKPGYSSSQPTVALLNDGSEWLFYASDAPGGKGKMDIWYTSIAESGQFADPVNLVSINTTESDITPYFHAPSQRLFFSSEGYLNLGGYDIYETTLSQGRWTEPAILPIPFNSSYNDLYFAMTDDGGYIYLASNRESPGTKYIEPELQACCNDIFRAKYKKEMLLVANTFSQADKLPLLSAVITLLRKDNGIWIEVDRKSGPSTHTQEFPIAPGQEYRLVGEKAGYLPDTLDFNTFAWDQPEPLVKDLYLKQKDILLEVFTYDDLTRLPLKGSTVRLYDVTDPANPRLIDEAINPVGNDFTFNIKPNRKYEIRGFNEGYEEAIDKIDTYSLPAEGKLKRDLYLRYKSLAGYLPLAVYFDNDAPGRRQRTKSTPIPYNETLTPYLLREQEYEQIFLSDLTEGESSFLRKTIREFFTDKVKKGQSELDNFCEALSRELARGSTVIVTVEGFTSPRAEERYNLNLGYRRSSSVVNYIAAYKNEIFKTYIKSGKLKIQEVSYGETRVPEGVNDDLKNERLSIYAVGAAQERRAEINKVEIIPNK